MKRNDTMIYKYQLEISDHQFIKAQGFRPLYVGMQNGVLCLWGMVDLKEDEIELPVCVIGTGHPMPVGLRNKDYVGSVIDGSFVWHVFMG